MSSKTISVTPSALPVTTSTVAPVTVPAIAQTQQEVAKPSSDPRLEQMARRERALRSQAKQLQAMKAELSALKAPKPPTAEEMKAQFLADPTKFGVTYEELANRYLKQPTPQEQEMNALRAELQALKDGQQKTLDSVEASQQRAYNQAVKQLTREVTLLVDGSEAFEAINASPINKEAVVAYIETTYKEDGILLTADEAAKQVEDYLVEEAIRLASLKKVRAKLTPETAPEPVVPASQTVSQTTRQPAPTLSRSATSVTTSPLSNKQRRERAIAAFMGAK
jgi:hypothetical protein